MTLRHNRAFLPPKSVAIVPFANDRRPCQQLLFRQDLEEVLVVVRGLVLLHSGLRSVSKLTRQRPSTEIRT